MPPPPINIFTLITYTPRCRSALLLIHGEPNRLVWFDSSDNELKIHLLAYTPDPRKVSMQHLVLNVGFRSLVETVCHRPRSRADLICLEKFKSRALIDL